MPVGETRPQAVDVRVLAATNADLEQRVAGGEIPRGPLLPAQRDPNPRPAAPRSTRGDPPPQYVFPARGARAAGQTRRAPELGHARPVRPLLVARQRPPAAERGPARGRHEPARRNHRARSAVGRPDGASAVGRRRRVASMAGRASTPRNLAAAVEEVEREIIGATLQRTSGNISETARVLGLTRRGLYLKMRRLGLDGVAADT